MIAKIRIPIYWQVVLLPPKAQKQCNSTTSDFYNYKHIRPE